MLLLYYQGLSCLEGTKAQHEMFLHEPPLLLIYHVKWKLERLHGLNQTKNYFLAWNPKSLHEQLSFFSNSDLQEDLAAIQNNEARAQFCSQRLLCRTLAGNNVYILTITSPASQVQSKKWFLRGLFCLEKYVFAGGIKEEKCGGPFSQGSSRRNTKLMDYERHSALPYRRFQCGSWPQG